jgi:hypothetical protein
MSMAGMTADSADWDKCSNVSCCERPTRQHEPRPRPGERVRRGEIARRRTAPTAGTPMLQKQVNQLRIRGKQWPPRFERVPSLRHSRLAAA